MNENKIAFIICSNNDLYLSECLLYLEQLEVPEGIETDVLVIKDAKSMLLGMKEGVEATDAKYKIYLHQDVFILNKKMISDILMIFRSNHKIGLIGMVGLNKLPASGAWIWSPNRVGNIYTRGSEPTDYSQYRYKSEDGVVEVNVVDGLLIATSVDVEFRTDLFDGWDFYDVSLSLEMRRAGYKVVVPVQYSPWVMHDDGEVLSLFNYNKYREIAVKEYNEFFK